MHGRYQTRALTQDYVLSVEGRPDTPRMHGRYQIWIDATSPGPHVTRIAHQPWAPCGIIKWQVRHAPATTTCRAACLCI